MELPGKIRVALFLCEVLLHNTSCLSIFATCMIMRVAVIVHITRQS